MKTSHNLKNFSKIIIGEPFPKKQNEKLPNFFLKLLFKGLFKNYNSQVFKNYLWKKCFYKISPNQRDPH